LVAVNKRAGLDDFALGALGPAVVPAVDGACPGQVRQELHRATVRVMQFADRNRYPLDLRQSLGGTALQGRGVGRQQVGGHVRTSMREPVQSAAWAGVGTMSFQPTSATQLTPSTCRAALSSESEIRTPMRLRGLITATSAASAATRAATASGPAVAICSTAVMLYGSTSTLCTVRRSPTGRRFSSDRYCSTWTSSSASAVPSPSEDWIVSSTSAPAGLCTLASAT